MTEAQRDERIAQIKADGLLRIHEKARAIEGVMEMYRTANFVNNGRGGEIPRAAWDQMSKMERASFIAGKN